MYQIPQLNDNEKIEERLLLAQKILKKEGYKLTKQRKLILEHFIRAERHLTVEDIYESLKGTDIGLATIYRNVKMLALVGIIKEIVVEGASYYELRIFSKKPLHIHFQCIKCNDIIDLDEREISFKYLEANKSLQELNQVEIYDANIMLIGLCSKCRG